MSKTQKTQRGLLWKLDGQQLTAWCYRGVPGRLVCVWTRTLKRDATIDAALDRWALLIAARVSSWGASYCPVDDAPWGLHTLKNLEASQSAVAAFKGEQEAL